MTVQAPRSAPRLTHSTSHINPDGNLAAISSADSLRSPIHQFFSNKEPLFPSTESQPTGLTETRSPSPNYFGLIVEPSTDSRPPDAHTRDVCRSSTSIRTFSGSSPKTPLSHLDVNPEYEAFRKKATESHAFNLGHGNLSLFASTLPVVSRPKSEKRQTKFDAAEMPSPKLRSPSGDRTTSNLMQYDARQEVRSLASPSSVSDFKDSREETLITESPAKKYTQTVTETSSLNLGRSSNRKLSMRGIQVNSSLPQPKLQQALLSYNVDVHSHISEDNSIMASASEVRKVMEQTPENSFLLLDLRVFPQYSHSRIKGALNLCIPTTLLKRPSFNLKKLNDTFTNEIEKKKFSQWPIAKYIIVYDAGLIEKKDAGPALNTLKKFAIEGWKGTSYILQGGFKEFAKDYPSLIDNRSCEEIQSSKINLSLGSAAPAVAPVAGGCMMPFAKSVANPFFSNIRQNQDLIGGVGQIDITLPPQITTESMNRFPKWLLGIAEKDDHGKKVSHKYLRLEQEELATMTEALSSKVSYGTQLTDPRCIRLAGIEKGSKNRYNNIWPYEHSRVKLLSRPEGACDYVNASHIKASKSNKRYIASQGPLPATFEDFWSVIWDHDVRVIVMLTAESENGQLKCHNYWSAQNYGQFRLKLLSEKNVPLETRPKNEWGRRRATTFTEAAVSNKPTNAPSVVEVPQAIIRKFELLNSASDSLPNREITQIHYCSWPDFGAPASPSQLLGLVELSNLMQRTVAAPDQSPQLDEPESEDTRPILVHCSAGCGRTGTFCTIDSVIDILKRQRKKNGTNPVPHPSPFSLSIGHHPTRLKNNVSAADGDWVWEEGMDLVEKTVEDFRSQRLSMVQNLRQFVLCYETVLEWIAQQVTCGQSLPPVHKKVSSVAFGFSGGRDRCGSVF